MRAIIFSTSSDCARHFDDQGDPRRRTGAGQPGYGRVVLDVWLGGPPRLHLPWWHWRRCWQAAAPRAQLHDQQQPERSARKSGRSLISNPTQWLRCQTTCSRMASTPATHVWMQRLFVSKRLRRSKKSTNRQSVLQRPMFWQPDPVGLLRTNGGREGKGCGERSGPCLRTPGGDRYQRWLTGTSMAPSDTLVQCPLPSAFDRSQ